MSKQTIDGVTHITFGTKFRVKESTYAHCEHVFKAAISEWITKPVDEIRENMEVLTTMTLQDWLDNWVIVAGDFNHLNHGEKAKATAIVRERVCGMIVNVYWPTMKRTIIAHNYKMGDDKVNALLELEIGKLHAAVIRQYKLDVVPFGIKDQK